MGSRGPGPRAERVGATSGGGDLCDWWVGRRSGRVPDGGHGLPRGKLVYLRWILRGGAPVRAWTRRGHEVTWVITGVRGGSEGPRGVGPREDLQNGAIVECCVDLDL